MKTICTQIAFFALLLIATTSNAQTATVAATNSGPALGAGLTVNGTTGFTSTNGTIGAFPKMQTTSLTSPAYHYTTDQSAVYFAYTFTKSQAGTTSSAPTISILYGSGFSQTVSATASVFDFADGTSTVYFSITSGFTIPANTDFKIRLTMTLTNGDKTLTANTLSTNAILTGAGAPLPVKFAGFYAKQKGSAVELTWNVGVEENVAGYEVQRSIDGSGFSKIGFISASNSSSYSFIDSKGGDLVYYRIKSVDIDGKQSYSIIVNIKGLQSDVVLKAFPMPVQSNLTVQHNAVSGGSIEIASADGRMFKAVSLSSNTQQTSIDLSSAKAGVYFVRLIADGSIRSLRIIKQ